MLTLRVLDVCCGIGGGARGYQLAGHQVTGIDVVEQPDYPGTFARGDALELLACSGLEDRFDAIHASFPCTGYSAPSLGTNAARGNAHPKLVDVGRDLLEATGLPYVLENVAGSPVRKDLMLCGEMFRDPADDGPAVIGHRWFEFGGGWPCPPAPPHPAAPRVRARLAARDLPGRALRRGLRQRGRQGHRGGDAPRQGHRLVPRPPGPAGCAPGRVRAVPGPFAHVVKAPAQRVTEAFGPAGDYPTCTPSPTSDRMARITRMPRRNTNQLGRFTPLVYPGR